MGNTEVGQEVHQLFDPGSWNGSNNKPARGKGGEVQDEAPALTGGQISTNHAHITIRRLPPPIDWPSSPATSPKKFAYGRITSTKFQNCWHQRRRRGQRGSKTVR
eukprot:5148155-Amphidinium_carterae.1